MAAHRSVRQTSHVAAHTDPPYSRQLGVLLPTHSSDNQSFESKVTPFLAIHVPLNGLSHEIDFENVDEN
jgi:hypothetical protein